MTVTYTMCFLKTHICNKYKIVHIFGTAAFRGHLKYDYCNISHNSFNKSLISYILTIKQIVSFGFEHMLNCKDPFDASDKRQLVCAPTNLEGHKRTLNSGVIERLRDALHGVDSSISLCTGAHSRLTGCSGPVVRALAHECSGWGFNSPSWWNIFIHF